MLTISSKSRTATVIALLTIAGSLAGCAVAMPFESADDGSMMIASGFSEIEDPGCDENVYTGDFVIRSSDDIEWLHNVTVINGRLTIRNTTLENLDGLGCLEEVGALYIEDNPNLTELNGLSRLESVIGDLEVSDNRSLIHVDGLESLEYVAGSLAIERNDSLEEIDGLFNLRIVGGDLRINENSSVVHLHGLAMIESVQHMLEVRHNDSLVELGLESLHEIGDAVHIYGNANLPSCAAEALTRQTWGGDLNDTDLDVRIAYNDDEATCE